MTQITRPNVYPIHSQEFVPVEQNLIGAVEWAVCAIGAEPTAWIPGVPTGFDLEDFTIDIRGTYRVFVRNIGVYTIVDCGLLLIV